MDMDGKINQHEASKLLVDECGIDEMMADKLFAQFDKDKDNKLNKDEFMALFVTICPDSKV